MTKLPTGGTQRNPATEAAERASRPRETSATIIRPDDWVTSNIVPFDPLPPFDYDLTREIFRDRRTPFEKMVDALDTPKAFAFYCGTIFGCLLTVMCAYFWSLV